MRVPARIAVLVIGCAMTMAMTARASASRRADPEPPAKCGQATLAPIEDAPSAEPGSPKIARRPHVDGRYTPILLVHGFNGNPSMWFQKIDSSVTPYQPAPLRSLVGQLQTVAGAAVYTLDYSATATHWFTEPAAGGPAFVAAFDCLMKSSAFAGHKAVVVAHSMGGLIARWAVTMAAGAADRAKKLSLAITVGTPSQGSWLASDAAVLNGALWFYDATIELIAQLADGCFSAPVPAGCAGLNEALELYRTRSEFIPGSAELTGMAPWPPGIQVKTLATRIILENTGLGFFGLHLPGEMDFGDGVVAVSSAISGGQEPKVFECRYTADETIAATDLWLSQWHFITPGDARGYGSPIAAVIVGHDSICGHNRQSRLIELTNEVLFAVVDELRRDQPTYAYVSKTELGLVSGSAVVASTPAGANGSPVKFTEDGHIAYTVTQPGRGTIIGLDVSTHKEKRIVCDCVRAVPAGGSRVAWMDAGRVRVADLSASVLTSDWLSIQVPAGPPGSEFAGPNLLGGGEGKVVLAYENGAAAYGGPEQLWVLTLDGSAPPRLLSEATASDTAAASAAADGKGNMAYVLGWHGGGCESGATLVVSDLEAAKTASTDSTALGGQYPGGNGVRDLWWGRDGQLYAIMSSWTCDHSRGDPQVVQTKPSLWRLDGSRWVLVDKGPVLAVRQLTGHLKAVVVGGTSLYDAGTLYSETDGKGIKMATGVWSIAAPA
jgi:pimeloyl-ACP methyl ester carboxylesterase